MSYSNMLEKDVSKCLNQLQKGDRITRRIVTYFDKIQVEPAFIDPDSCGEDWCNERCLVFFNPINGLNGMVEYEEWKFEVIDLKQVYSKETTDGLTVDNRKIFSVKVRPIKRDEFVRYQRIWVEENFFWKEVVSGTRVVGTEKIPVTFEDKKYRYDGRLITIRTVFYEGKTIHAFELASQLEKDYLDNLKQSLPKGISADTRFLKAYLPISREEFEKILLY